MLAKIKESAERVIRTAIQAGAGAALVILTKDGASWEVVPAAASVGAFAALVSFVMFLALPPKS